MVTPSPAAARTAAAVKPFGPAPTIATSHLVLFMQLRRAYQEPT